MSMTKEQALQVLARALGVSDQRKAIPVDKQAAVLHEVMSSMAGSVSVSRGDDGKRRIEIDTGAGVDASTFTGQSNLPKDSATAKLAAFLNGTEYVEPAPPAAGHVNSEPSAEMQEAIDKAVHRALAKHGINTDEE